MSRATTQGKCQIGGEEFTFADAALTICSGCTIKVVDAFLNHRDCNCKFCQYVRTAGINVEPQYVEYWQQKIRLASAAAA